VFLNVPIMQQPGAYVGGAVDLFDSAGAVTNEVTRRFFKTFMTAFAAWIEKTLKLSARYLQRTTRGPQAIIPGSSAGLTRVCIDPRKRSRYEQTLPWSGLAPSAFAAASDIYSPFFVLPYHSVPGQ